LPTDIAMQNPMTRHETAKNDDLDDEISEKSDEDL